MEEEDFDNAVKEVTGRTMVIQTDEVLESQPEGTFWLYSVGMKATYDTPDLEIRGVPGMFVGAGMRLINELNGYRLVSDKPVLVGQSIDWSTGRIVVNVSGDAEGAHRAAVNVETGEDWEGRYEWIGEDMLRLTSMFDHVCGAGCGLCSRYA
jgi:hypothetical protein